MSKKKKSQNVLKKEIPKKVLKKAEGIGEARYLGTRNGREIYRIRADWSCDTITGHPLIVIYNPLFNTARTALDWTKYYDML